MLVGEKLTRRDEEGQERKREKIKGARLRGAARGV